MQRAFPPLCVSLVAIGLWQTLHAGVGGADLPGPAQTIVRLWQLLRTGAFWDDLQATMGAFAVALLISITGGIILGVTLGANRGARLTLDPILSNFQALPKVTLYPIVLACFGLGLAPKIAFGVMHALVPMTMLTSRAIHQVPGVHWRTARALHLSRLATTSRIILPAILPELVAATRMGASLCLLGVLIGEMFAAKHGLGFAAMNAVALGDTPAVTAIGAFLVLFAVSGNMLLLSVEHRLQPWTSGRRRA